MALLSVREVLHNKLLHRPEFILRTLPCEEMRASLFVLCALFESVMSVTAQEAGAVATAAGGAEQGPVLTAAQRAEREARLQQRLQRTRARLAAERQLLNTLVAEGATLRQQRTAATDPAEQARLDGLIADNTARRNRMQARIARAEAAERRRVAALRDARQRGTRRQIRLRRFQVRNRAERRLLNVLVAEGATLRQQRAAATDPAERERLNTLVTENEDAQRDVQARLAAGFDAVVPPARRRVLDTELRNLAAVPTANTQFLPVDPTLPNPTRIVNRRLSVRSPAVNQTSISELFDETGGRRDRTIIAVNNRRVPAGQNVLADGRFTNALFTQNGMVLWMMRENDNFVRFVRTSTAPRIVQNGLRVSDTFGVLVTVGGETVLISLTLDIIARP